VFPQSLCDSVTVLLVIIITKIIIINPSRLSIPKVKKIIIRRLPSLPSNLRQTTRECAYMYLVARGHFQSCDKNDGHNILSVCRIADSFCHDDTVIEVVFLSS